MDNDSLNAFLQDTSKRQFWVKQWGVTVEPEPRHESVREGSQYWANPKLTITFARSKNPPPVQEGDILLVHLITMPFTDGPRLVCIGEAISSPSFVTDEQLRKDPGSERWPWSIRIRNLAQEYSSKWSNYSLHPYRLADEYIKRNPSDKITRSGKTLNTLKFGKTLLWVQEGFAKFVINEVLRLR